ncbi:MAG: LamG-like jellyroll fold domain-containing protein, partial [bacterium]
MKILRSHIIVFLAVFAALSVQAVLTNSWLFSVPAQYVVSDPSKIEVANGVANLKFLSASDFAADMGQYLSNSASVVNLGVGPDVSINLQLTGGLYRASSQFSSRVFDGGSGNQWLRMLARTVNRNLNVENSAGGLSLSYPGLIGLYRMDGDWSDGMGNFGTPVNNPVFTTKAKIGTAAGLFNGSNYLQSYSTNLLNGASAITMGFWSYLNQGTPYGGYLGFRPSNNQLVNLYQGGGGRDLQCNFANVFMGSISEQYTGTGTWHFVVMTWSYSSRLVKIYVDAVKRLEATAPNVATVYQDVPISFAKNDANLANLILDDVFFFRRALSDQEILYIYSLPSAVKYQVRTGNTLPLSGGFVGPLGTTDDYFPTDNGPLSTIGSLDITHRYIQYRAYMSADTTRSATPWVSAAGFEGSSGLYVDDVLGDFSRGDMSALATIPASKGSPFVGLADNANGGVVTNGIFTSRILDGGVGAVWGQLSWQKGLELTNAITGLEGLYHMEGLLLDASGKGRAGTGNNVTFTDFAKLGRQSAVFNGINSAITLPQMPSINTVELWVKNDYPADGLLELIASTNYLVISNNYVIANGYPVGAVVTVYVNGNVGAPLLSGWNHVAVVSDTPVPNVAAVLGGAKGDYFSGQMDDVAFYSRSLFAPEIVSHYVAGRRMVAGKIRMQVRTGTNSPPTGAFTGIGGGGGYFDDPAGASLAGYSGRYLQYQATLLGDGGATPALDSVTLTCSGTNFVEDSIDEISGGTFDAGQTRWHGDEMTVLNLANIGPANVRLSSVPGALALWHMDEGTWVGGGSVRDASGNGYNGTPEGSAQPYSGSRAGAYCGSFGGSGDDVALPSITMTNNDFSVAAWFNTISTTRSALISESSGSRFYALEVNGNGAAVAVGQVTFVINDGSGAMVVLGARTGLNNGQWHHVAGVRNGNQLHIYIDGVLFGTTVLSPSYGSVGTLTGYLARHTSLGTYYAGYLDEVGIYQKALSESEIGELSAVGYATLVPGSFVGSVVDPGQPEYWQKLIWGCDAPYGRALKLDSAMSGLWHCDAVTNSYTIDATIHRNDASVAAGVSLSTAGKYGSGLAVTTGNGLTVNDSPTMQVDQFTIDGWVWPTNAPSLVLAQKVSGGTGFTLGTDVTGRPYVTVNGMTCTAADILRARKWSHFCATYDRQVIRLYVNGFMRASIGLSSSAQTTTPLLIGPACNGILDEFALYSRALNSEEVTDHYRAGIGTLRFQVRSGVAAPPVGSFVGPDGTVNSWFTDFDGSDLTAVVPVSQFIQYQAVLATEDPLFAPKLDSVRVDATAYPTDNPWVMPADGFGAPFLGNLWSFFHVASITNSTGIQYQISGNNGTNWYAFIGGVWTDVSGYTNSASQWTMSNTRSVIDANIQSFYNIFYQGTGGTFKFRAFLKSDAIQQVSLDEVDLGYSKGRLLLTSPNGLEVSNNAWVVGVPYNITWTSSGSVTATNIIIELYNQSGSNYVRQIAVGATNSGIYRSVINTDPGVNYRIRIRDGSDSSIFDWSDNDFELIYNLHLSIPNGGEKWYVGDTNGVSWESPLATEMALWLSNDDGVNNWVEVARAPAVVGTNGYVWAIQTHEDMLPSLTARMAVSTPDVATPYLAPFFDVSDHSFVMAGAVVTYPNASTGVKMGDSINVLWTSAAAGPNVSIELFDGSAWVNVAASAPNVDGTNSYTCVLNAPNPTEAALIRITSLSDARIVNVSEAFLLADIRILSPKGGTPLSRDRWQITTTNFVTWVAGGAGNLVNVDYSTDGVTWTPIAANYVNTNSSGATIITNFAPQWIIQGPPSSSAVVRVSSVSRPDLKATTEYFDIAGVQVVSPNNGEYWEFTGTNVIKWLHQGAGFNLGIWITYNGGNTTNDYVTLDPSLSIFSGTRTINPGRLLRPSTLAKIRLVANDTLGYPIPMIDLSDNYFVIRGLSMFLPTTNNVYTMGTTVAGGLQWYSAATEDPTADLYYSKDGSNFTSLIIGGTANIDAGTSLNNIPWTVSRTLEPSKTAKVKVIAGSYQSISPVFTLRGIRVTRPAAGQTFDLGSSQFVYWTAAGLSDNAYMSNVVSVAGEGGTYVPGGLPGNTFVRNGALTWNISSDLDPTTNAVIKMIVTTPTNDTDIVMYSDPFILRGAKILSPSTGTNWMIGTQRTIVYVAAGMAGGAVGDIYYSGDGATFDMTHPVAVNVPMASGINSVVWDIENTSVLTRQPSTNAVLMLISGTVTNLSKPFRMGGIKVTVPKGTDIWAVSDLTNTIQWVGVDTQPSFRLFYTVYDAPQHSAPIASGVPGFAYDWAMTSNAIGNQVTVTITDGVTTNESEKFVVVPSPSIRLISPAVGDFWKVGETNNVIRWVRGGNMSNDFTVGYSAYPFSVTNTIATGAFPSDNGIYYFTWGPIPNSLGQVRLVVVNNPNPNIVDSLDDFRIAAAFQIQPFIGSLHALEPKDVNWTTLGSVSGVDFYYSTDPFRGSNSWTLINTAGPFTSVAHAQASSYIWNVPNIKSSTVWFRIQDHAYPVTKFDIARKGPYDDLGTFEVLYYTVVWRLFDSATSNELDGLSVTDSSGWSSSGLTSPLSHDYPYGFWNTVWFKQYFNDKIILNWSSKTISTNVVYMTRTEASPEYHVLASFVYDPSASVFKTVAWLERSSQIITDPTECKVYIYDPNGNEVQVTTAGAPRLTGVFWADVGALLDKNIPYFAKVEIKHSGVIYTSGITFTLLTPSESAVAAVNAARDAIMGSVSNVNENVIGVGLAQQAFRTDVTNRLQSLSNTTATISLDVSGINSNLLAFSSNALSQLGGITNAIGVIGPGGTNLLDQVRLLTQDMAKRTARILTRPGTVKSGSTVGILYRSQAGMALGDVKLEISNAAGVSKLGPVNMAPVSGGVYELSFIAGTLWGLGDFTVTCSDSSGASDRIILKVAGMELDDLAGSMIGISNQLAGVETTLATMSVSVSNISYNVGVVTNELTGMIVSLDSISNSVGQLVGLTNLSGSIAAMTSAVAQITVLTNMGSQLSFITNMVGQLGVLTNLSPQMASVTNSMGKVLAMTNQMNALTTQMGYVTNVIDQIVILTNINPAVAAMTNAVAQISGLTNMGAQLNYLTNAMGSVQSLTNLTGQIAGLSNLTATTSIQIAGLSNLTALTSTQIQSLSNAVGRLQSLTNLNAQMAYLTNVIDQVTALTNMASSVSAMTSAVAQISGLTNMGAQLNYLTNSMGALSSLTNLTPQMAFLTNITATTASQVQSLSNAVWRLQSLTNLNAQMAYLTNVIDQVTALTNMASSVSAMTSAVAQISGLTNMGAQLAYLTNAVDSLTTLTNLTPQMAFLTNITGATAAQSQYMTNLLTRMSGLTNLTPQMGYLTNAVWQLQSLTNLNAQMAYLTNVIDQVTALTNMASSVSAMTGAVAQISVLTNMGAQLNYLTNSMGALSSLTNLTPQVGSLTNLLTRMSGLTNLTPQVASLTNSMGLLVGLTNMPGQLSSMTNVISQLTGLTNISAQVAQMTNSIAQISGMTNLPSQMNYLTNVISQLTGLTNISDQVAQMTNSISQISGMTNLPSQMNYLTNVISQLTGLTNISGQVAQMTNSIGQIAGMTNLPGQMNYLTNVISQLTGLTNISDQVAQMTNSIGQVAGLTNLPNQMNYLTNIISQLSGMTNISEQVAQMTNSIGLIAGLTNLSGQMDYMTNAMAQMGVLTGLVSQVSDITNSLAQMSGLTNVSDQVAYLTNLLTQMSSLTNIEAQVGTMTNSIAQIAGMTNMPAQMNYLTNVISQLTGLTNISDQVAQMTNSIAQISGMTNLPSQMNYLTNVISQLTGLTNISDQV